MVAGVPFPLHERPMRRAFQVQRCTAKRRGIPFLLSFEEWWTWSRRMAGAIAHCGAPQAMRGPSELFQRLRTKVS